MKIRNHLGKLIALLVVMLLIAIYRLLGFPTEDSVQAGLPVIEEKVFEEVDYCERDGLSIYGKFYYPEGFDRDKAYPVIIMCHGYGSSYEAFEKRGWTDLLTGEGYVCYSFDFCGGSPYTNSDMDFKEMSALTETEDLLAVTDFVQEKDFCDRSQVYYMGFSQGGLVNALAAAQRPDDIAGMLLLYPAFNISDLMHQLFPDLEAVDENNAKLLELEIGMQYIEDVYDLPVMDEIRGYKGDVLIMHGMNDGVVPCKYSVKAMSDTYAESDSQLLLLSGENSGHSFDRHGGRNLRAAQAAVIDFMECHVNSQSYSGTTQDEKGVLPNTVETPTPVNAAGDGDDAMDEEEAVNGETPSTTGASDNDVTSTGSPDRDGTNAYDPEREMTPTNTPDREGTSTYEPKREVTPTDPPDREVTNTYEPKREVTPTGAPKREVTPTGAPKREVTPTGAPKREVTPAATKAPAKNGLSTGTAPRKEGSAGAKNKEQHGAGTGEADTSQSMSSEETAEDFINGDIMYIY
ncbi:MAG: alpha/beta fold hydrolase [Blautia sp.]|nr:alpha/beta fold hydrolase [Blautia sp.]